MRLRITYMDGRDPEIVTATAWDRMTAEAADPAAVQAGRYQAVLIKTGYSVIRRQAGEPADFKQPFMDWATTVDQVLPDKDEEDPTGPGAGPGS